VNEVYINSFDSEELGLLNREDAKDTKEEVEEEEGSFRVRQSPAMGNSNSFFYDAPYRGERGFYENFY
jgi:hypothetical protein